MLAALRTKLWQILRNKNISQQDIKTFSLCWLTSFAIWVFFTLNKEVEITIIHPVSYTIPDGWAFSEIPDTTISVRVAYNYFSYYLITRKKAPDTVFLNLKQAKYQVISEEKTEEILSKSYVHLGAIKSSNISNINVNLEPAIRKKVPVRYNVIAFYRERFTASRKEELLTDSVEVIGAPSLLNQLNFLETDTVKLHNVDEDRTLELNIIIPDHRLRIQQKSVKLLIHVVETTENSLQIPIQVYPTNSKIKIFPKNVNVRFIVTFDNLDAITNKDFIIRANANGVDLSQAKHLPLEVYKKPKACLGKLRLDHEKVRFIVGNQ